MIAWYWILVAIVGVVAAGAIIFAIMMFYASMRG